MERVERLTNLVAVLLDTRVPLTIQEILDRVPGYPTGSDAARQAFERDKRVLREEGVPVELERIEGEDQIGYRIPPEAYYLPPLELADEERVALHLALAAVHFDGSGRGDALWKLGSAAPADVAPLAALPAQPALAALHDAHRRRAPADFRHRGEQRTLDVYGLLFRGGFWYAIGRDHRRDAVRSFRVDRIEGEVTLGPADAYEVPDGFDPATQLRSNPWEIGGDDAVAAEVLVDAALAPQVVAELGEAAVAERRSDGSVVVQMPVTNRWGFRAWLLALLDHAEVLAPDELRADVVAWLEAMSGTGGR